MNNYKVFLIFAQPKTVIFNVKYFNLSMKYILFSELFDKILHIIKIRSDEIKKCINIKFLKITKK